MDITNVKEDNCFVNISILGKSGSGKTATIVKLLTKRFIGEYSSSIDDKYYFTLTNESKNYLITIQDTSDQTPIDLDIIVKWSHIIIVMFSIIDRSSFQKALTLIELIFDECLKKQQKYSFRIYLVANKIDLDRFRVVLADEGTKISEQLPISYHESSAIFSHTLVENLFLQMISNYLNDDVESLPQSANSFSREKSTSPFTNVGMYSQPTLRQSNRQIRNSVASLNDKDVRRNSTENLGKIRNSDFETSINSSKTSLNNLINSSTRKIKSEGLKLFKRPK